MLITLGWIALVIGIILVVLGYTVEGRALRPGWGCVILAVVLIVLGYLLPSILASTSDNRDGDRPSVTQSL
jgi:uncharacterized membrane protein